MKKHTWTTSGLNGTDGQGAAGQPERHPGNDLKTAEAYDGETGLEILCKLKDEKKLQQVKVLILTAKPGQEERRLLLRCREVIDSNLRNPGFCIEILADSLAMSHSALYKKVKAMTGMSLIAFINDHKIHKAVQLFCQGETNIERVGEQCGINDPKHFRTLFKRKMNMLPKQFVQSL